MNRYLICGYIIEHLEQRKFTALLHLEHRRLVYSSICELYDCHGKEIGISSWLNDPDNKEYPREDLKTLLENALKDVSPSLLSSPVSCNPCQAEVRIIDEDQSIVLDDFDGLMIRAYEHHTGGTLYQKAVTMDNISQACLDAIAAIDTFVKEPVI